MDVGFVHDWIVGYAGSERVVAAAAQMYPAAPLHTLLYDPAAIRGTPLEHHTIHTSFLQHMPGALRQHRRYLPLMPLAIEQLDLRAHEVVVSSSHAVAKGVLTRADQVHVSYVHTPMRYAWDLYLDYLDAAGLAGSRRGWLAKLALHYLRTWDAAAANRVDVYVANSHYVARRIEKTYRRSAQVVYPPVDVERFKAEKQRDDSYLTVARLVSYKRVDLIVRAFAKSGRRLVVIGDGPGLAALRETAGTGDNVTLLGEQPAHVVAEHMARCRAFVFAAEEDFGIAPVEAQAAGAPVIAFGRGGARETVVPGRTGLLFDRQDEASLNDAVAAFEASERQFDREVIVEHAQQFSRERFQREFVAVVERAWAERASD
ncbi:MAG: glycosyltransferase [Phycisphaeraceae bacterium]